ncbi:MULTISPECIES: rhomboid family intramembrane serine protease [Halobacterium]|uniref:rhomboid family intramembrane serine protease n=1 Tax=Halobacterium TaxID=2239 RepID=UPI00073F9CC6|nr:MULTISPECIES: rhomboid family intramembrane serine protease [Halobacterium]MCG1002403.1 rhomboid family intramembrane serine protease [Halobacterium noricense]
MATCDRCGDKESMPYQCRLCGGTFCSKHRLPENHDCPGLDEWNDPGGVFDSGFDDSVTQSSESGGLAAKVPFDTGPGGVLGYFRGNVSFALLAAMWLTFVVQYAVAPALGIAPNSAQWLNLFTINTTQPLAVWTWVTSVFSHGGFGHIVLNSIVLYFFGPVVEKRIGSAKFVGLFVVAGALAGLAQVGAALVMNPGWYGETLTRFTGSAVLGASGAIAALMGVLTVLNPNLRIYLYFVIPMPLWLATLLFAGYSIFVSTVGGGIGGGGVAQFAHLAGLALGVLYGVKLKREGERAPKQLQFGGGGPGGPGGPGRRRP